LQRSQWAGAAAADCEGSRNALCFPF